MFVKFCISHGICACKMLERLGIAAEKVCRGDFSAEEKAQIEAELERIALGLSGFKLSDD